MIEAVLTRPVWRQRHCARKMQEAIGHARPSGHSHNRRPSAGDRGRRERRKGRGLCWGTRIPSRPDSAAKSMAYAARVQRRAGRKDDTAGWGPTNLATLMDASPASAPTLVLRAIASGRPRTGRRSQHPEALRPIEGRLIRDLLHSCEKRWPLAPLYPVNHGRAAHGRATSSGQIHIITSAQARSPDVPYAEFAFVPETVKPWSSATAISRRKG